MTIKAENVKSKYEYKDYDIKKTERRNGIEVVTVKECRK